MEVLHSAWLRLTALFRRRRLDRDLDDEVAFHLAMREQRLRAGGDLDARLAARRQFGNPTFMKEETRAMWTFRRLEQLGQDLRYAARSMRKTPAIAAVIVLSLALGIGANTAIFTLIDAVMLRMLPVRSPQELVRIDREQEGKASDISAYTNPLWEALRDRQDVFAGVFAWSLDRFDLARGGAVQYIGGLYVSGSYFSTLGVTPAAGRLISASDDVRGCAPVAVLSYGFWQSHYGGSPAALGSSLSLDHQIFQVIGVSAPGFAGVDVGSKFDVAVPICSSAVFDGKESRLDHRSWWWLNIMGRMKPGMPLSQARARLAVLSPAIMTATLPEKWPDKAKQRYLKAVLAPAPAATGLSDLRRGFSAPLNILMALVAMVLLIACANIASLLLARATSRNREIAIRKALGASRGRLIRQLLTEAVSLSALGALLGLFFARWGSALLVQSLATHNNPVFLDLSPDARVLGFTAAIAVLCGLVVGLLPALRSTRVSLVAAMKGSLAVDDPQRSRFRAGKWIVSAQVALCLVLLIGGGLLLRSFVKLVRVDLGFDRSNVLLARVNLDTAKVPPEKQTATFEELDRRFAALPGVISISRSVVTPLSRMIWNDNIQPDTPNPPTGEQALADFNYISPGYFATLRTPLLAGRNLNDGDTATSPQVAVINQTLAKRFFPGMNPLGHHFRPQGIPGKPDPLVEVVGVAADSKYDSIRDEMPPTAFFPITQQHEHVGSATYALRVAIPLAAAQAEVQQAAAAVNQELPLNFVSLQEQVDDNLLNERLLATLSAFFGGLALLLAMIGLYGVLSYLVTQRQTEFGIRMAVGAQPASILRLVLSDVLRVLGAGIAAGVALSLALTGLLQKMLYGLAPRDAVTVILAVGVLSATALLAGLLPARRAARVDPMVALRYE